MRVVLESTFCFFNSLCYEEWFQTFWQTVITHLPGNDKTASRALTTLEASKSLRHPRTPPPGPGCRQAILGAQLMQEAAIRECLQVVVRHCKVDGMLPECSSIHKAEDHPPQLATLALVKRITKKKTQNHLFYLFCYEKEKYPTCFDGVYCKSKCSLRMTAFPEVWEDFFKGKAFKERWVMWE